MPSTSLPTETIQRRGCGFYLRRGLKWFSILLITLIVLGVGYQTLATELDKRAFTPRGELYTVNGHQMHMVCRGAGSPTVILEAGGYADSLWWYRIQRQMAEHTRVCAYDRPGLGYSEPTTLPRDPLTIVGELHTLLEVANIQPPYVLVGHSYGAILTRIFATQYSADVQGLVLVDSGILRPAQFTTEAEFNEWKSSNDLLQVVVWGLGRVGFWRLTLGGDFRSWGFPEEVIPELVALRATNHAFDTYYAESFPARPALNSAAAAAQNLGDLPIAILWADYQFPAADDQAIFTTIQQEFATFSTNSVSHIIAGSSHGSLLGDPQHAQQVSTAILEVLNAIATHTPLSQ